MKRICHHVGMSRAKKVFSNELHKQFIGGKNLHKRNVESLRTYFGANKSSAFDGSYFESYDSSNSDVNRITASDIVAVTFLSMEVRRESKSGISTADVIAIDNHSDQIGEILRSIPTDRDLHGLSSSEFDRLVGPDSAGVQLWSLLRDKNFGMGMHRVAAFKLIARKRPRLYPIADSQTEVVLGRRKDWWSAWYEALVSDIELVDELEQIRNEVSREIPRVGDLSLLRVADVVIWYRQRHGH